jgi:hypothetical protein
VADEGSNLAHFISVVILRAKCALRSIFTLSLGKSYSCLHLHAPRPRDGRGLSSAKVRFAQDSALEGDGFEPSVPRERGLVDGMETALPFESGGSRRSRAIWILNGEQAW